ncbi:putative isomerase YbhE [Daldinia decipiens]|uniref:putative isomerase YbhE n=1 Tax=Daldinia decipiens TaxID=326647 RepID=UPI0020C39563|nr:putative isomerase YbhE [Daldinia decipiens]KAI1659595.1 putative isomerase YbhE [Daldinia decipiens]
MKYNLLPAAVSAGVSIATARDIYVASYAGLVYRLAFTSNVDGSHSLREVGSTLECGRNPGWLELDPVTGTLFCANEAYTITNAGSVASFSKESFSILGNITTDYGPAQSTFYAPNRLGLAHYSGGAVSVDTSDPSNLAEIQSFHYFMDKPGPNSTLQDKPYPHGIVVDPTGRFLVVLDRGADALRTYAVGWDARLVELGAHYIERGNGPRHGVFVKGSSKTFFYVLGELTNSLHGFEAVYGKDGTLGFEQFYKDSAYQTGFGDVAAVAIPAEIAAAEDGRHIVLSTRDEGRSMYRGERSDTIASYSVDFDTGDLALVGLTASGGLWPRSFAISKDGTLFAAANQHSVPGRLVVFARDPETGVIDDQWPLVTWTTDDTLPDGQGISHVIWDE